MLLQVTGQGFNFEHGSLTFEEPTVSFIYIIKVIVKITCNEKSWSNLNSNLLFKMGQDFLDILNVYTGGAIY